jgi:hypothetical protein
LDRRLGGPRSRPGRGGEEKYSQPLTRLEPRIIQPVAKETKNGKTINGGMKIREERNESK